MSYFKTFPKPAYLVEVLNFTFLNIFFFHLKKILYLLLVTFFSTKC